LTRRCNTLLISIDLDSADATVLLELLELERGAFEDARSTESQEPHENWETLLELTGSYTETLQAIDRIKKGIEDGRPA
jgi:hypothetical protein